MSDERRGRRGSGGAGGASGATRRDVDDELRFHLESRTRELLAEGASEAEARAQALAEFGDVEDASRELSARRNRSERSARRRGVWDALNTSRRHAWASVKGSPATSLAVIATLALGVGVTTAVFSIVYGVLMRPLPYADSDRLVRVWLNNPREGIERDVTSYPDFRDWREQSRLVRPMAAVQPVVLNLTGTDAPAELRGEAVSEGYFGLLGVEPDEGRVFVAEEESLTGRLAVVLSHELWTTRFGADRAVLGGTIQLSGEPYDVVGVMPPGLSEAEFWIPLQFHGTRAGLAENRNALWLPVIGRLAPGADLAAAQAELDVIAQRIEAADPEEDMGRGVLLEPLRASVVGAVRQPLLVLLGAVGFVLLIACANIANVLLARGTARRGELAVCAALGASRLRLASQAVFESLLLAAAGGVAGLLLASLAFDVLVAAAPDSLPRLSEIRLDATVLGFGLLVTIVSGVLFGLAPALEAASRSPAEAIRRGGRGAVGGARTERLRPVLVAAQFGLAVMLLIGAGLMLRSFAAMQRIDPGLDPTGVVTAEVRLPAQRYGDGEARRAFYDRVLERVRALPGVASADAVSALLLARLPQMAPITMDRAAELPQSVLDLSVAYDAVTPGLFETLGMRLLEGRAFATTDGPDAPTPAIVNEAFVRRYVLEGSAVARRFAFGTPQQESDWITIVGVVADAKRSGLTTDTRPYVFFPVTQYMPARMQFVVRAVGDPLALAPALRRVVRDVDPDQPLGEVRMLDAALAETVAPQRFLMVLLATFAVAAILLAAIGIYGVMAYVVGRRTREIGVRIALGAQRSNVLRLVVGQAMAQAAAGLALGLFGAFVLREAIRAQLFDVAPADPLTFAATAGVLALVALLASWLPARRAAAIDPVASMKTE